MGIAGAAFGLVDAALCASLAVAVLAAAPGRWPNRTMALLLVAEGAAQLCAGLSEIAGWEPATLVALGAVLDVTVPLIAAFAVLVVTSLDSPLTRPLRGRVARASILACGIGLALWAALASSSAVSERAGFSWSPAERAGFAALGLASAFGFAAGASAFAAAGPRTPARRQAGAFLLAFGARDAIFGAYVLKGFVPSLPYPASPWGVGLPYLATFAFVPLATYGILRAQVLDIDLRLKRGMRRALFALPFVVAFFVVSQSVERYTTSSFGILGGILAAALLFLVSRPIERFAERLSDVALPDVAPSTEYVELRKLEVYRAAVEAAHESGGISAKEHVSLDRLRAKLGIRTEDAAAIESEVVTGGSS